MNLEFGPDVTFACADIQLEEDNIVENPERFFVRLTSDDPAVTFDRDEAEAIIVDTTSKCSQRTEMFQLCE